MDITLGSAIQVTASTDLWLAEIRAGRAFTAGATVAASVGNFSELQLTNPLGSSVRVIIRAAILSVGAATRVQVRTHNPALVTFVKGGTNLLSGASAGQGQLRSAIAAVQDGTIVGEIDMLAATPFSVVPEWYFELPAQTGVLVVPSLVNTSVSALFMWREV